MPLNYLSIEMYNFCLQILNMSILYYLLLKMCTDFLKFVIEMANVLSTGKV